jgi:hypothetical protein
MSEKACVGLAFYLPRLGGIVGGVLAYVEGQSFWNAQAKTVAEAGRVRAGGGI